MGRQLLMAMLLLALNVSHGHSADDVKQVKKDATQLYSIAAALQNRALYRYAAGRWHEFLKEFPDDERAARVRYYLATCHYQSKQYQACSVLLPKLLREFPALKRIQKRPKHSTVQDRRGALLLAVACHMRLAQFDDAKRAATMLENEYPQDRERAADLLAGKFPARLGIAAPVEAVSPVGAGRPAATELEVKRSRPRTQGKTAIPSIKALLPRLPRDNLLVYRGENNEQAPVGTTTQWNKRRKEIVTAMQVVMGTLPGREKRCALDMKVQEEVDCGRYVRRLITYSSEPGSRVPAYLLVPKALLAGNGKQASAILCLHGTDNIVGHGVVVGIGDKKNRQYARELAERGYVTLAPNYPLLAKYQPDIKKLGWKSGTLKAVWDNMRGLDLLESLPYVKREGFGAIGHSLGGHNTIYTSVLDDRIKVAVSSCGLDSYLDYFGGDEKRWRAGQGWTQTRYMPRLANYRGRLSDIPFDFHELIGAIAPRHVLIIAPEHDRNFRAESVDRIVTAARPIFKLYGQPTRLGLEHPDCGHDFPEPMREVAYNLFDSVLP